MNNYKSKQLKITNFDRSSDTREKVIINKDKFIQLLNEIMTSEDLSFLKNKIYHLRSVIIYQKKDNQGILNIDSNGDTISIKKNVLISEFDQIMESKTIDRAKYYLKRLINGYQRVKTNKVNEINIFRWKEYDNIITDSLWLLDKRDSSGAHIASYWGNFIPQIPNQMLIRYTKKHEWVLDTFLGSGTTLIECKRLGRNGIGIELNPDVVQIAKKIVNKENNKYGVKTDIITGDNRKIDIKNILSRHKIKNVQLIIMHPPYHDIIKFSNNINDLSNAKQTEEFLEMFSESVNNATPFLQNGRYLVLVIGDKYSKGEWIPLGFYCMEKILEKGYSLKSIIVKNFEETKGKRNQKNLWRYRALVGGFYIFKHEYIMLFKKNS